MTSTYTPIVPVYRAVTIVATVLRRNRAGESCHVLITDTTLPDTVEVVYVLVEGA
ncbi:MAG: hypothetical protein ABI432_09235 [Flavobacteriales bacterium]